MKKIRTAKQKAALRKAQLASARKRKGRGKKRGRLRKAAKVAAVATVAAGGGYVAYKNRKKISKKTKKLAAKNPYIRRRMAKKLLREARARRAGKKRG